MEKTFKKSKLFMVIMLVVLGCLLISGPVFAEGTGDGSGGGKNIPLGLVSSEPADGQKDVALTGDIQLHFNKNVIYLLIRDANKKCFSLSTKDGIKVPIEVIMADDQTPEGFEKRRDVSVRPLEKLEPGTAYVVKVSPDLQAKNGTSLGSEAEVNFVTAGTAAKSADTISPETNTGDNSKTTPAQSETTAASKDSKLAADEKTNGTGNDATAKDNKIVNSAKPKPASGEPDKNQSESASEPSKSSEKLPYGNYALIAALIVVAIAGYIYIKKRK